MEPAIKFQVPTAEERTRAIGSMGGVTFSLKKAYENVDTYWAPKVAPGPSDWLAD